MLQTNSLFVPKYKKNPNVTVPKLFYNKNDPLNLPYFLYNARGNSHVLHWHNNILLIWTMLERNVMKNCQNMLF